MDFLRPYSSQLLSLLRIMSGLLLLQHGTTKYLAFPASQMWVSRRSQPPPNEWPDLSQRRIAPPPVISFNVATSALAPMPHL